jgi:phage-related minor tail protein
MRQVKKDVQTVTKEFKALTKKIGQLTTRLTKTAVAGLEQAQAAIRLKSPAQHAANALKGLTRQTEKLIRAVEDFEKAPKKKGARPKAGGKAGAKKAPAKKPRTKKAPPKTSTGQVEEIIRRSRKGVAASILMQKTGFKEKKVRDIIARLLKEGRIKRVRRGTYGAP